jgi:hypothetical protein
VRRRAARDPAASVERRVAAAELPVRVFVVGAGLDGVVVLGALVVLVTVVALLAAETAAFAADGEAVGGVTVGSAPLPSLGAATVGRALLTELGGETGALTLGAGTGLGVTAGTDGVDADTGGVAALATGVLTVAEGTVTPTEGTLGVATGGGTGGVTGGTVALTAGPGVVAAGVFTETPTTGAVTATPGTVTLGMETETDTTGRPAPSASAEPAHPPTTSRETRTTGPRIPRMYAWSHRCASRNRCQTTLSPFGEWAHTKS